MREHALFDGNEAESEVEGREQPRGDEERQDDRPELYYKLFELKTQGFCNGLRLGKAERRKFEHEGRALLPAHKKEHGKAQPRAEHIQKERHQKLVPEEGRGEREIDGELCAAREIGKAQNDAALHLFVVEAARREDGSRRTAEAHQKGKDCPPAQPNARKSAVRKEGKTG